jgi:hypothetical protein
MGCGNEGLNRDLQDEWKIGCGASLRKLEALRIWDDSKTDIGTEAFCSGGGCGFGGDVSAVE